MADTDFTSNPYLGKFRDAGKNREAVYAEIYDGLCSHDEAKVDWVPSRLRQKRVSLYRSIIGKGHNRILEIGCGLGDLSLGLSENASQVVGTDVSGRIINLAVKRLERLRKNGAAYGNVTFHRMGATDIRYQSAFFDWVVSTSVIEHLHPEDIQPHLTEVHRVLRKEGRYLVWAPNGLGHHGDREMHLSMFSYRELEGEMRRVGFHRCYTTFLNFSLLVDVNLKISLEAWMNALGIKTFWSRLGIRNILLVVEK